MELKNPKSFKLTTNWAFDLFAPSATVTISPGRMVVVMMKSSTPASPHHSPHQGVPHAALKAIPSRHPPGRAARGVGPSAACASSISSDPTLLRLSNNRINGFFSRNMWNSVALLSQEPLCWTNRALLYIGSRLQFLSCEGTTVIDINCKRNSGL